MGLLDWLLNGKEKENKKESFNLDFELFKALGKEGYEEIKSEEGKLMQELEDKKLERRLRNEAYEQFVSWRDGAMYIGGIGGGIYYIHNDKYAKYKDFKLIDEYKDKCYKEFVEKAINEVEDWQIQHLTKESVDDYISTMFYSNSEKEAFRRKSGMSKNC